MKNYALVLFVLSLTTISYSQNNGAYQIYNAKGKKVKTKKFLKKSSQGEFVFFGEYHNNPISHWLQFELATAMFENLGKDLVLSFEMFERDQQELISSYLNEELEAKEFEDSCRLWPNYHTDYLPLIKLAKDSSLHVVAANIPRRYARLLFKQGRDALKSLSAEELAWMASPDFPVDSTLSQYADLNAAAEHMGGGNLMEAQAIKDATMAKFILRDKKVGQTVLHFNGAYHSDFYQGIVWYILEDNSEASIVTISTVSQEDISKLEKEHFGRADFIICVDEDMTVTH